MEIVRYNDYGCSDREQGIIDECEREFDMGDYIDYEYERLRDYELESDDE